MWTLADILIHIRYTGKGKVQIKKTLSLSLSLSFRILLGIIYEYLVPKLYSFFFAVTLCVSPSVTRSTSILMLFLDKNFYFFVLFSLARSLSKEERRKDFIRIGNGVIFRFLSMVLKRVMETLISRVYLIFFFKYFLGDRKIS